MHRQIRYFRIAVPHHLQSLLGKTEIRRSLDGLDSRTARSEAMRLSVIAQTFFAFLDDLQDGRIHFTQKDNTQHTENTHKFISMLDTFWFDTAMREKLSPAALVLRLPTFLREIEVFDHSLPSAEQQTEKASPLSTDYEEKQQTKKNTEPPVESPSPTNPVAGERSETSSYLSPQAAIRIRRTALPSQSPSVVHKMKSLPTLEEAADSYITAKKLTWSSASAKDIPPQIRQFVEIVRELECGRNLAVDQLTREHIRRYYDTLRYLPFRVNGQHNYKGKTWMELAEMGRSGMTERLLSLKTLEVRQTNIRSFVNWCELEYRGMIQARYVNSGFPKVLSDKNIRRKGVKRESFSHDELHALLGDRQRFAKATAGIASRFWCPWIALYSGMRLEEICQLHLSDIREIEGVWCFSVNEENAQSTFAKHVKSAAGIRNVPIHPWLWHEAGLKGFLELRWQAVPHREWAATMLFPDMQERAVVVDLGTTKLGASVTKWFTRYRRSVGIGGQEGEASPKTFHSFRHTVIEYLHKQARVDLSMLQAVVGHEKVDMGVTEGYAGEWHVKNLLEDVILKLQWNMN